MEIQYLTRTHLLDCVSYVLRVPYSGLMAVHFYLKIGTGQSQIYPILNVQKSGLPICTRENGWIGFAQLHPTDFVISILMGSRNLQNQYYRQKADVNLVGGLTLDIATY